MAATERPTTIAGSFETGSNVSQHASAISAMVSPGEAATDFP